jgi:hypothetical protein
VCSLSVGLLADGDSSCATTSVGLDQAGTVANANVPITAQDNTIGLLNQAASALGLTTGQAPASTTQNGAVNADVPISLCSVNVGLAGSTSSDCALSGSNGSTSQQGAVDAVVPVTVCDVIVEVDGNSSASCPQEPDSTSQSGQAADLYAPATVCGAVVEVDGTGTGSCTPDSGFPLANDLPNNSVSQSAPVDGVLPVNACSVVVAVDGSATNSCEPAHVAPTATGSAPVTAPLTICAATGAVDGTANGTCTGSGSTSLPVGSPSDPGTGATLPVTVCGIEAALGSSCQPSASTC